MLSIQGILSKYYRRWMIVVTKDRAAKWPRGSQCSACYYTDFSGGHGDLPAGRQGLVSSSQFA